MQTKEIKLFGAVIKRVVVHPSTSVPTTPLPFTPSFTGFTSPDFLPLTSEDENGSSISQANTGTSGVEVNTINVGEKDEREVEIHTHSKIGEPNIRFGSDKNIRDDRDTHRDTRRDERDAGLIRESREVRDTRFKDSRDTRDRDNRDNRGNRDTETRSAREMRTRDTRDSKDRFRDTRDYRNVGRDITYGDRDRAKAADRDKERNQLRDVERELEKLRAKDNEQEVEIMRLRAQLTERDAEIEKLAVQERERKVELDQLKEKGKEAERYKGKLSVFDSIVEKHKKEAETLKTKNEKLIRDILMQKREYEEQAQETQNTLRVLQEDLGGKNAFIAAVQLRVQEMRNNVEEQGQLARDPEFRVISDEFLSLADTLLGFVSEGAKAVQTGEGATKEETAVEIGDISEPYDPLLPSITPVVVDEAAVSTQHMPVPVNPDYHLAYSADNYAGAYSGMLNGAYANQEYLYPSNVVYPVPAVSAAVPPTNSYESESPVGNRLLVEGLGIDSQSEASVWKYLPPTVSPTFTTIGQRGFSQIAFQTVEQAVLSKVHIDTHYSFLQAKFVPLENNPNLSKVLYISQLDQLPQATTLRAAVAMAGEHAIVKPMQGGEAAYAFVYYDDHEAAARAKKFLVDNFPYLKIGFYMKNSLFEINSKTNDGGSASISVTMSATPSDSLYLSDISLNSKEMREELAKFGEILFYQKRKSAAIVRFETVDVAVRAKQFLGVQYNVVFVDPITAAASINKKRKRDPNQQGDIYDGAGEEGITVVYLGGLDISFTSRHLPPLLEEFHPESILLHVEKACAFIYLSSPAEAQKAMKKLRHNLPANVSYGNKSNKVSLLPASLLNLSWFMRLSL